MQTYATTQRARTSNIATLTIGTHLLDVGMRIHVSNTGGAGYTTADAVISAITSTTISYVSTGSNEGTTSDTAGSIMVYDPGVSFHYLTEPSDSNVLIEADFLILWMRMSRRWDCQRGCGCDTDNHPLRSARGRPYRLDAADSPR